MTNKLEERRSFIINVLYFALAAALLYFGVKYALGWILPFLIGFVVALLLRPIICLISAKCRIPNKLVAIVFILLFYAVFGVLITLVGIKLILILRDFIADLPGIYTAYIEPLIKDTFDNLQGMAARLDPAMVHYIENMTASVSQSAGSLISSASSTAIKALTTTATSVPGFLLAALLTIISSVFFSMDFKKITDFATNMLPEKIRSVVMQLKTLGGEIVLKYIKSYAILMSVTFVELSVGFLILGVNNAFALAALIALVDLLPILGTGGIVIPWALIELLKGNLGFATGLAIVYVVILIVRNILEPKIVGDQIGVHPLAMLISMYVGLQVFGFIGIFVLPILLVTIKGYYDSRKKEGITRKPDIPART